MEEKSHPTMLVLGRQGLPTLQATETLATEGVRKGAYIVSKASDEAVGIIIAAGSEVSLSIEAQARLAVEGIHVNVVSMPSWDLFDKQSVEYQESVLPSKLQKRLTVEMGSKLGWREYAGSEGAVMSIDTFGASAPGDQVIEEYGFTVENVVNKFKALL